MTPKIENALLHSQLHDAKEQARRDSHTIERLSAALDLLVLALPSVEESERFDKPSGPHLSKRIRAVITTNLAVANPPTR